MRNLFISVLGTNKYNDVAYVLGDEAHPPCPYVVPV